MKTPTLSEQGRRFGGLGWEPKNIRIVRFQTPQRASQAVLKLRGSTMLSHIEMTKGCFTRKSTLGSHSQSTRKTVLIQGFRVPWTAILYPSI